MKKKKDHQTTIDCSSNPSTDDKNVLMVGEELITFTQSGGLLKFKRKGDPEEYHIHTEQMKLHTVLHTGPVEVCKDCKKFEKK